MHDLFLDIVYTGRNTKKANTSINRSVIAMTQSEAKETKRNRRGRACPAQEGRSKQRPYKATIRDRKAHLGEIAALPLVARNDNLTTVSAFAIVLPSTEQGGGFRE